MPFIIFYLSYVFILSAPSSFFFCSCFEDTQEVFVIVPEIETFSMKHVVSIIAIVVLIALEDLKGQAISSPVFELAIIDITIDPYSLISKLSGNCRGFF